MTKIALQADFATWRPVQGRKVLQLIFEVPIEHTEHVLKVLGVPHPGDSKWCTIELLKDPEMEPAPTTSSEPKANGSSKKFHELPLSQQAAIRCGDVLFQEFVRAENEVDAASAVRVACDVSSRSSIIYNSRAGDQWLQLEQQYQAWLTDRKFAEAKR